MIFRPIVFFRLFRTLIWKEGNSSGLKREKTEFVTLSETPSIGHSRTSSGSKRGRSLRFYPSMPMILPRDSIIYWKGPIVEKRERCFSLLFPYQKNDTIHHISIKRPLLEPFSVLVDKLLPKVNKMLKAKQKEYQNLDHEGNCEDLDTFPFEPIGMDDQLISQSAAETVFDTVSSFRVNGRVLRLIREPVDIACVKSPLRALVGCPVVPTIDYRRGSNISVSPPPTYHWFVKSDPSTPLKGGSMRLAEGSSRSFVIDDCEYRSTGPIYYPEEVDVGKKLVVVCDLGEDCIVRVGVSTEKIETLPETPLFESRRKNFEIKPKDGSVRLLTYNILADLYLSFNVAQELLFFPYCEKKYQQFEYRYPMILSELKAYNADILFLQEVDHRMQYRYLGKLAAENGYEFRFEKKDRDVGEGCAILWKKDLFRCVLSSNYTLASLLSAHDDVNRILESSEETKELIETRPTILQVVQLESISSGKMIVCGNTHLHHNPKHDHVKVLQALVAVRKIAEIVHLEKEKGQDVTLLLGGDFNSTPDGSVYELLLHGSLKADSACWKLDENIVPVDLTLCPHFQTGLTNITGTPAYTNYTKFKNDKGEYEGFAGCLDYIWASSSVHVSRNLPLPSHDDVTKHNALPAPHQSSDHLAVIVEATL